MPTFTKDDLTKLTKLSRIECVEEEKELIFEKMSRILSFIQQLQEVDTEGVKECDHILETLHNVMREDEVGALLDREVFLNNAPSHVGGMIRVPPVIKFTNS